MKHSDAHGWGCAEMTRGASCDCGATPDTGSLPALVGMMGKKRSGKNTYADRLSDAHGFAQVAFATPLRRMALAIDPYVYPGTRLSGLVRSLGWEEAKDHGEVRRLLQVIGTDAGRNVLGADVWVSLATAEVAKLRAAGRPVVITDVRFPNEAKAIRDAGGLLVRVTRPAPLGTREVYDEHPSETALDGFPADCDIQNSGTIEQLHAAADIMAQHLAGRDSLYV